MKKVLAVRHSEFIQQAVIAETHTRENQDDAYSLYWVEITHTGYVLILGLEEFEDKEAVRRVLSAQFPRPVPNTLDVHSMLLLRAFTVWKVRERDSEFLEWVYSGRPNFSYPPRICQLHPIGYACEEMNDDNYRRDSLKHVCIQAGFYFDELDEYYGSEADCNQRCLEHYGKTYSQVYEENPELVYYTEWF